MANRQTRRYNAKKREKGKVKYTTHMGMCLGGPMHGRMWAANGEYFTANTLHAPGSSDWDTHDYIRFTFGGGDKAWIWLPWAEDGFAAITARLTVVVWMAQVFRGAIIIDIDGCES